MAKPRNYGKPPNIGKGRTAVDGHAAEVVGAMKRPRDLCGGVSSIVADRSDTWVVWGKTIVSTGLDGVGKMIPSCTARGSTPFIEGTSLASGTLAVDKFVDA